MIERTVTDKLREEYFSILPQIRLVAQKLETRIKFALLPLMKEIKSPARLDVKVRVKDCESAIEKLRKKNEGRVFDTRKNYSLAVLEDLAGARVLTFMGDTMSKADILLKDQFRGWRADHKKDQKENLLWLKYKGKCDPEDSIAAEYQICPMLLGLFGEVEHAVIYKPTPDLRGIETVPEIQDTKEEVYNALRTFEQKVEEEYTKLKREKDAQ